MNGWIANVPALLHVWYPGQEGGRALAEVLTGDVNPSGRLPVTFERRFEDNPVHDTYYPAAAGTKRVVYSEGVFMGYAFLPIGLGFLGGGKLAGDLLEYFGAPGRVPSHMWYVVSAVGAITTVLLFAYDRLLRPEEAGTS